MTDMQAHDGSAPDENVFLDRSFLGMLITQFLGVLNDNIFKQIVLFVCLDYALEDRSKNLQGIATVIFAAPFILLSGYCGYLSDLYSKRTIVVISKILEIVMMTLGLCAFLSGSIYIMLGVLFLMGAQSALFGPAKYGILPELFRDEDLPKVNGVMMMTMFFAIILGFTAAGFIKESIGDRLWIASSVCIGVAIIGTLTSLFIRQTPIAQPDMKFHWSAVIVSHETQKMLWKDRRLSLALGATALFWLTGGVVYPPAINDLGRLQFGWSESATGQLAACTGLGIAVGCAIAGVMSQHRFNAKLIHLGSGGILIGLIALSLPGESPAASAMAQDKDSIAASNHSEASVSSSTKVAETSSTVDNSASNDKKTSHETSSTTILIGPWGAAAALIWLGVCAGLFTVPLQVYLQARTPDDQKGRVIGAMNLANWIGIASAGFYYDRVNKFFAVQEIPPNAMFGAAGLLVLPLILFYRPHSENLGDKVVEIHEPEVH